MSSFILEEHIEQIGNVNFRLVIHYDFKKWKHKMIENSPTSLFWDLVYEFVLLALIFTNSNDSNLCVESV